MLNHYGEGIGVHAGEIEDRARDFSVYCQCGVLGAVKMFQKS